MFASADLSDESWLKEDSETGEERLHGSSNSIDILVGGHYEITATDKSKEGI